MVKISNVSSWQKNVVKDRANLTDLLLSLLTERKVRFEKITYLAKTLAKMIESHESRAWGKFIKKPCRDEYIRKPRGCAFSTLLRNPEYRAKLDAWWAVFGVDGAQRQAAVQSIDTIKNKLELITANKKLKLYKIRVDVLEKELDELRAGVKNFSPRIEKNSEDNCVSNDTAKACRALHLLIREFDKQVIFHEGQIVSNTFAKRVIVSKELGATYQKWLKLNNNITQSPRGR